jgi:hypothetical protein
VTELFTITNWFGETPFAAQKIAHRLPKVPHAMLYFQSAQIPERSHRPFAAALTPVSQ